jgi:hypothetical protein
MGAAGKEQTDEVKGQRSTCSRMAAHLPSFTHPVSPSPEELYQERFDALQRALVEDKNLTLDKLIPDALSNIRNEEIGPFWGLCWQEWCNSTLDRRITLGAVLSVMRGLYPRIEVLGLGFF